MDALFDKREKVDAPHRFPWSLHGFIECRYSNGFVGRGTATLIDKSCLITAAHCLYDYDHGADKYIPATEIHFYLGRNNDRYTYKLNPSKFIVHPQYLQRDENYDFGVIKLEENIGLEAGWASLKVCDDVVLEKETINVSGYPADKGFLNILRNVPSYNMYTMTGPIAKVTKNKIYYRIDTSEGQSGAGVWVLNPEGIVECLGVHVTGHKLEGNGAIRITEENLELVKEWLSNFNNNKHYMPNLDLSSEKNNL